MDSRALENADTINVKTAGNKTPVAIVLFTSIGLQAQGAGPCPGFQSLPSTFLVAFGQTSAGAHASRGRRTQPSRLDVRGIDLKTYLWRVGAVLFACAAFAAAGLAGRRSGSVAEA